MGIIIRQSVKSAIWSYLGIVIGYINVGIIMPNFFDTAQVGLVQLFASVSLIFAQFGTMGFTSVINRLFPVFRNPEKHHHGFLFLVLVTGFLGFTVCVVSFFILRPWIIDTNIQKSPLLVEYLWLLMPLVFMRLFFTLLDNYNKMLFDSVTGTFWIEFMHKLINLGLIIVYALKGIGFSQFFFGYILSMCIPVIPVVFVLIKRRHFNLRPQPEFLTSPIRKEISSTMIFGFVNGLAGIILVNVDKIFVNQYLSLEEVGVFSVCALFASLIRVPYNSISKIAIGIISEAWKKDDRKHIQEIYQKTAINQAIIGTLIFIGILVNLHNLFEILPPEYSRGRGVMIIYSAGILFNSVLGLAGTITETSKYFRMNTVFLGMLLLSQLILSFLLTPHFGITGAAIATVSSLILGALYHVVFQWFFLGISGINPKLIVVAVLGLLSFIIGELLPDLPLIPDIFIRSSLVTLVFMGLIFVLNVSYDLNQLIITLLRRFTEIFTRSKK